MSTILDRLSVRTFLAVFWSIFSAVYITCITFIHIEKSSVRFADTILGFMLGTVVATVVTYYFGSAKEKRSEDSKSTGGPGDGVPAVEDREGSADPDA